MSETSPTVVDLAGRNGAPSKPSRARKPTTPGKKATSNGSSNKRTASAASTRTAKSSTRTAKSYKASLWPRNEELPQTLCKPVLDLQKELGLPVLLLLQYGEPGSVPLDDLDDFLVHMIRHQRSHLPANQQVALVINSPGGSARCAYGLARILHRRCGGFIAVVPDAAMSAATLLTLGADRILMGPDASLGPLDAQIMDIETETFGSVLNEVQALERLRAYALESVDETMQLLLTRTGKRIDTLMPHVLRFVSDTMQPLLAKIDVVHYNERARILKVGEEYAVRLLRRLHPLTPGHPDTARQIASTLVESYPEHGFWIDREEAEEIGLTMVNPSEKLDAILEDLWVGVQGVTAIGMFEQVTP